MTVRNLSFSAGLLALTALPLLAGDWTQFRGPGGGGVSAEKGLPVRWSADDGLAWKVALPGRGLSNPVIAAGRIYLTACSGFKERRLHVLCFDQAGKKLWERQFTATGSTACNEMTCMAAPTPVTDGENVYALFATGDLAALGKDGTLLWYRSLVGDYPNITNQVGMAASPVLVGDTLLLPLENAGDSFAAGLDKKTGKNKWKVKRRRDINWVTPLVFTRGGQKGAVFSTTKEATAYDVRTGKVLWTVDEDGLSSIPSPAQGGGLIFLPGTELRALKPGAPGSTPEVAWRTDKFPLGFPSPLYHKGRLYGLSQVAVVCLDAKDGKELWRQRLDGPFSASPLVADGKLYAVSNKGRTTVVELGDTPKVLAKNDLDDTILATPAIANGCIYLRSDKFLYCIAPKK
jgi:outer membrane protein assembly factor BamB